MNYLFDGARQDKSIVDVLMSNRVPDCMFYNGICMHFHMAIVKLLKCAISLKGLDYSNAKSIDEMITVVTVLGYTVPAELKELAPVLDKWMSMLDADQVCFAIKSDFEKAARVYTELERVVAEEVIANNRALLTK